MKFWLIVFFLTPDGEFISKKEVVYPSKPACVAAAGNVAGRYNIVNKQVAIQVYCVSNNHHAGIKQDPGIPYD